MKAYLLGIAASAMVLAILQAMLREGAVKRAVVLAGGLLTVLMLVGPAAKSCVASFGQYLSGLELRKDAAVSGIAAENKEIMAAIIAEKTEAYILDKAVALGASVEVRVEVVQGSDYPYPWSAEITGTLTEGQRDSLASAMEASLAIPEERQVFTP